MVVDMYVMNNSTKFHRNHNSSSWSTVGGMVHSDLTVLVWLMTCLYVGIGTYVRTTSDSRS